MKKVREGLPVAAEKAGLDFTVFLVLAAVTGAKRGELSALRWNDMDLDGRAAE